MLINDNTPINFISRNEAISFQKNEFVLRFLNVSFFKYEIASRGARNDGRDGELVF